MGYLGDRILKQWKVSRPKMCQALERQGDLKEAVSWANERAKEEMGWLMKRGTQWWQAEEVALANQYLPTEKEQAKLTQDQMPFLPIE